jgi:hypothetical protein
MAKKRILVDCVCEGIYIGSHYVITWSGYVVICSECNEISSGGGRLAGDAMLVKAAVRRGGR